MNTDNKKPSADGGLDLLELLARAIGERLMNLHPFMRLRKVDVVEGVVLVERVDLVPCEKNSTSL